MHKTSKQHLLSILVLGVGLLAALPACTTQDKKMTQDEPMMQEGTMMKDKGMMQSKEMMMKDDSQKSEMMK